MERRLPGRVLALTPGDLEPASTPALVRKARDAIGVGLDSILVREPSLSDRATLALAHELRELLGESGWLGIHDRVHLAAEARADGVHLGFRSLPVREARAICAQSIAIGLSGHAHDTAGTWDGADYLLFGPVFATPSKVGLVETVGVDGLERAVRSTFIPIWALGGITLDNGLDVVRSSCYGLAARAAILGSSEPAAAATAFMYLIPHMASYKLRGVETESVRLPPLRRDSNA